MMRIFVLRRAALVPVWQVALLAIFPNPSAAVPSAPSSLAAECAAVVDAQCYVDASGGRLTWAGSPGAVRYRVCRSEDTSGWGGCNFLLDQAVSETSYLVSGSELPADGLRRAYYVSACDGGSTDTCSKWSAASPVYLRTDRLAPEHVGLAADAHVWRIDDGSTYRFTVTVDDAGAGVREVQASIDRMGSNADNPRGLFSWRHESLEPRWPADRVACAGGGWASKNPRFFHPETVSLVGCASSELGGRRTVTFEVRPESGFGEFGAIRDIAAWADDFLGLRAVWTNTNLDFRSRKAVDTEPPSVESAGASSLDWIVDDGSAYEVSLRVTDLADGVVDLEAILHGPGGLSETPRGRLLWRVSEAPGGPAKDVVSCAGGGGVAALDASGHRATALTLIGCRSELEAEVSREVTFVVRPNPTFGVLAGPLDLSVSATDAAGNRLAPVVQALGIASRRPADAPGKAVGYQGVLDAGGIERADAEGIGMNLATLLYQRKQCAPHYWRTEDTAAITDAYRARNVKAMVVLENLLFADVNDPIGDDCQPLDPPPPLDPSPCFQNAKWRLLPDWRARLDEFVSLHGAYLTSGVVDFFLLSSEVNDRCFDMGEVAQAAQAVRYAFPGLRTGLLYGAAYDASGARSSQPPPASIPLAFDVVGVFSYNLFDVTDPLEARNATGNFFNPEDPADPSTVYGDLLSKLAPHQEVMLVFDAGFDGTKEALAWQPEDLADVALSYVELMRFRPEVTRLGGFTWQGLLELPQPVRDSAARWICEWVESENPVCVLGGAVE